LNNPLAYVDKNGLWPTWIHQDIIDEAFPGLSRDQLRILYKASEDTDYTNSVNGVDPQDPAASYVHGMSDGLTNQDPAVAQQLGDTFIAENERSARQHQAAFVAAGGKGISPNALTAFGNALHTVTDRTSPAHAGHQPWYGTKGTRLKFRAYRHFRREEIMSLAERKEAIQAARQAYARTFGEGFYFSAIQQLPPRREPPPKRKKELTPSVTVEFVY
jgi:hypothetical protein